MQHHAAITMRFAASTRKLAPIYAQNNTRTPDDKSHAAIPMRSATGDSTTPYNYAHTSTPKAASSHRYTAAKNKPKEYPQQPETKTVAKHAMSEVCLLPRPSYSRGRAYKAQSQHKHFMKNRFSKSVRNTVAKIPEARAKAFSQRTAVRLTLHFIYLTYIIHISYVLYITYIFYTVFYTIFSRSTSTSTPSSSLSPSSSSSPTSVSPTLSTPPTHFPSTPSI